MLCLLKLKTKEINVHSNIRRELYLCKARLDMILMSFSKNENNTEQIDDATNNNNSNTVNIENEASQLKLWQAIWYHLNNAGGEIFSLLRDSVSRYQF